MSATTLPVPDVITIYGADWCGDCRRAKRFLDAIATPYRWVDVDADPAAQRLIDDAGYRAIPVIVTPAGAVLVEPSNDELEAAVAASAG